MFRCLITHELESEQRNERSGVCEQCKQGGVSELLNVASEWTSEFLTVLNHTAAKEKKQLKKPDGKGREKKEGERKC